MFGKLFSSRKFKSPSGFFKIEKHTLIPVDDLPGNGSINAMVESLGYPSTQVHTILTFDSPKIQCLGVKLFTREPLMVLMKEKHLELTNDELNNALNDVNWESEYASDNVDDILKTGVMHENLTLDFLQSVLGLTKENETLYKCRRFGLFLQFEDNLLKHFTSAELENTSTKWLKNINPQMVQDMLDEAMAYHGTEFSAMEEVNRQADALRSTPHAVDNPFLHLHRTAHGNVSFFNILITHYGKPCSLEDFLLMNEGRYQATGNSTYKVSRFIYAFDDEGQLETSTQISG